MTEDLVSSVVNIGISGRYYPYFTWPFQMYSRKWA